MRHVFTRAGHVAPLNDPFVASVWAGIRNEHGAPPTQSAALTPPLLWDIIDATPTTNNDGTASIVGLRNRAVILVGWWAALRRSEIVGMDVEHLTLDPGGYRLAIPRSKTNQTGIEPELKALPRKSANRCPVAAIQQWCQASNITTGPLFRGLTRVGTPRATRMNAKTVELIMSSMLKNAGVDPQPFSPHSLRAGFITTARVAGMDNTAITHQTDQHPLMSMAMSKSSLVAN